ncbi:MAG TPA: DNA polymerase/3'-5' exonuclease PolX [bacterium]
MPVSNAEIAAMFAQIADLLEIQGENPFRVRAYRAAARTVGDLARGAAQMVGDGEDLAELPGIGKDLAGKIREAVERGTIGLLEELRRTMPGELGRLLEVAGLGPKRVQVLWKQLGITTLAELEAAAKAGKIRELPGLGEKTESAIVKDLGRVAASAGRTLRPVADEAAELLLRHLRGARGVACVEVAGSFRRGKETVGDLDVLASGSDPAALIERFAAYDGLERVTARGESKASARLRSGLQVDLRVIPKESYGAALHYFTGSKAHNIAVRTLGVKKGLKINEYGVFRGTRRIGGAEELDVFRAVGLPLIPPELREDRGEIAAARGGTLPKLVELRQIRGDLHAHTSRTDGRATLEEMAAAARSRGYEYLAITEHSRRITMSRGLDAAALRRRNREIDALNARLERFTVLKGIEVDILEDGSLDLPDAVLAELDVVVAAVHSYFNLPQRKQTERIVRALDNPHVHILAHPSGRIINERDAYELDLERVIEAAAERGRILELDAHPQRLDLDDVHCRLAKERAVKVAISTDAHAVEHLDFMRYGVGQARRGWLEAADVANTLGLAALRRLLKGA